MGTLYVVATPIGNLKDITLRALETLKGVKTVYAEDTRVTAKLFAHHGIMTPLKRYDEHSHIRAFREIREALAAGASIALVTDAGTPGIADPGSRLVAAVRVELPEVPVEPVPGPSALAAALSVSGVPAERFTFLGYPPHKKGRETFFREQVMLAARPVVFYESPHRLTKAFAGLLANLGPNAELVVAHELTKLHGEVWRGKVVETFQHFIGKRLRGEFVIIVP